MLLSSIFSFPHNVFESLPFYGHYILALYFEELITPDHSPNKSGVKGFIAYLIIKKLTVEAKPI